MTEVKEHDFTQPRWGRNLSILNWNSKEGTGRGCCWTSPVGPRNDDILTVKSEQGSMRLRVSNVTRAIGVDDMYMFDIHRIEVIEEPGLWVTKVKRKNGAYSIIDVLPKKDAQALADEFNEEYQTDNYFIEPYDEKKHAYSRHG